MPLMADAVRILKSSEGAVYLLRKWRSCLQSALRETNSFQGERDQLNSNFVQSTRRLLGSRYIFWPVFDPRCVCCGGSLQLSNVMPFRQRRAFPVGRCRSRSALPARSPTYPHTRRFASNLCPLFPAVWVGPNEAEGACSYPACAWRFGVISGCGY